MNKALETILLYAFGLTLAYVVAAPVAKFVGQSFADAAANFEQAGK